MTLNLTVPRELGACLVLFGIVVLGGVTIATAWADLAAAVQERDAKTTFVTRSLATRRGTVGKAGQPQPDGPLTVVAESDTLAAAQVDALVRGAILEAGGAVLSSRAEAKHDEPSGAGASERIEIQAVVEGTMEALQAGLYRIETGRPAVLVDAASLHDRDRTDDDASRAAGPVLNATLTLSAFWERPKP